VPFNDFPSFRIWYIDVKGWISGRYILASYLITVRRIIWPFSHAGIYTAVGFCGFSNWRLIIILCLSTYLCHAQIGFYMDPKDDYISLTPATKNILRLIPSQSRIFFFEFYLVVVKKKEKKVGDLLSSVTFPKSCFFFFFQAIKDLLKYSSRVIL
jgi:hypothetical protein